MKRLILTIHMDPTGKNVNIREREKPRKMDIGTFDGIVLRSLASTIAHKLCLVPTDDKAKNLELFDKLASAARSELEHLLDGKTEEIE